MEAELGSSSSKNPYIYLLRTLILGRSSKRAVACYRIASYLHSSGVRWLSFFLFRRLETRYGLFVSPSAKIGVGLKLPHPTGIIVGAGVVIGKNCTIYQHVTIGGKAIGDADRNNYPQVGDDVVLYAGAKVLGGISLGSGSRIGANSVVVRSVPKDGVAAGVPAKLLN